MLNPKFLDDISARISELIAASPAKDMEKNARALLSSAFTRLDRLRVRSSTFRQPCWHVRVKNSLPSRRASPLWKRQQANLLRLTRNPVVCLTLIDCDIYA